MSENSAFREGFINADGLRLRYMEAGAGPPLIHLHGAGGLHLTPGHDLLAKHHRVIAFEMPGFGTSAENTQSASMADLAATMAAAVKALGIGQYNLMGSSFGGKVSLWLATQHPDRILALVLEAPAAIRPSGMRPPSGTPEEIARRLFAYPDRAKPLPALGAEDRTKQMKLTARLRGPDRDTELEARMRDLQTPTLVLFGTLDHVIPGSMGRFYKELLPNCHLVFVYDAGHLIAAERPEAFADVALDFLERQEAFVINRRDTSIHP